MNGNKNLRRFRLTNIKIKKKKEKEKSRNECESCISNVLEQLLSLKIGLPFNFFRIGQTQCMTKIQSSPKSSLGLQMI